MMNDRASHRMRILAAWACVGAFALLVGRYWSPYFGFTSLLQIDASDRAVAIHEVREQPIFVYSGNDGYDADTYSQIAFHPLLGSSELKGAVSNLPYRARHILPGFIAWTISLGDPTRIANTYACINLVVWLILAWLTWRILAVRDWKAWMAWAGFMFSAGVLYSVRLALVDLPALALVAAAMMAVERGGTNRAVGWLAAAGLARETALTAVVGIWDGPAASRQAWWTNLLRAALCVAPLAIWLIYVRWMAGSSPAGFGNFTWPVAGYVEKWIQTVSDYRLAGPYAWLNTTTLLALVGVTVQAIYIGARRRPENRWWRVGAVGVGLMALFGTAVWEGHPGATARLLMPLGLAFAVLAVRDAASWRWIVAGSLSVFSGFLAFAHPSHELHEVGAGFLPNAKYILRSQASSYGTERTWKHTWAWSGESAQIRAEVRPATERPLHFSLGLRAISEREITIRQGARVLWHGLVGKSRIELTLDGVDPRTPVDFAAAGILVSEGDSPGARHLGFAIYDAALKP